MKELKKEILIDLSDFYHELVEIKKELSRISIHLAAQELIEQGEFISKLNAKKKVGKGTTWFWEQRKCGLPFYKLGGEVFYKKSDLNALFVKQP